MLKFLQKISFAVCLTCVTTIVFATDGKEKKVVATPPDNQQQGDKKSESKSLEVIENIDSIEGENVQSVDSAGDSSVSKYNFIFYFLYKTKYNEDQELEATL